ncbi:MAG: flagellar biosynthetic protein FliO [bacterium]|nr:flagellar biosynthetic protein FliO [bacterium]
MGYLSNFIVYVLAMIGVIMLALFVFKHVNGCNTKKSAKRNGLKVVDTLSLSTRKTLYVIEAEGEKFLIAGDIDRTTLISKLNDKNKIKNTEDTDIPYTSVLKNNNEGIYTTQRAPYESVMKNLAEKLRG